MFQALLCDFPRTAWPLKIQFSVSASQTMKQKDPLAAIVRQVSCRPELSATTPPLETDAYHIHVSER
jgi:hypothetical protein